MESTPRVLVLGRITAKDKLRRVEWRFAGTDWKTASGFKADLRTTFDITERTISVDLMLRLPLIKTADAPQGLVQPYIAVGLPLVITNVDPRNTRLFRNHHSATDLSFGAMGAGGVAVQVYKNLALFAEYRFNHVSTDVDLQDSVSAAKATFRTDLNSHSALIGISARW